jgi:antitoxin component of MazEF toxin-antitoxin module
MGYRTKIQRVERAENQSFYVNFPSAVAQAMEVKKGEEFEWLIEDKNVILLRRVNKASRHGVKKRKN